MAFPDDDAGEIPDIDDLDETGEVAGDDEQAVEAEEELTFGEEDDDDTAPGLPKKLRNEIKERDRALALANKRIAELDKPAAPIDVGPRPTREEHDWDDEAYDAAVDAWNERKLTAQTQASEPNDLQAEAQRDVQNLTTGLAALTYPDKDDIVPATMEMLTPEQQFIFATAAKDPAKLIYALGKNPSRMKALLEIKNPVKFITEVARTEMQMTVKTRQAPQPEHIRNGDARPGGGADKELARLEKEAQRTGDRTALIRYNKEKAAKKAA
jgi:hypothetical protein